MKTKSQAQQTAIEKLYEASVAISSAIGLESVANTILSELNKIIPSETATLQIVNGEQRHIVSSRGINLEHVDEAFVRPISGDQIVQALVNKEVSSIRIPALENVFNSKDTSPKLNSKYWIGVPLLCRNEVVGLITVGGADVSGHLANYKYILELFASQAAGVLQSAILYQQNIDRVNELTQAKEKLEIMLSYFDDHQSLALIGLVYGESIHYARNQLGMAKTVAKNIIDYDDVEKSSKQKLSRIIDYINSYLDVLNSMQTNALQRPTNMPLDLRLMIDQVLQSKRISLGISIEQNYQISNLIIYAPEKQMRQVLFVIIQNALDAMEGKGILSIKTTMTQIDTTNFIQLAISDTGKGISKENQEKLFKMRLDNENPRDRRSSGMGLVWARSFMRSYGGDIFFETSHEKGTTMYINVPKDFRSVESLAKV